jgi:hypothetical protein
VNLDIVSGYKCAFENDVIIKEQYICNAILDSSATVEAHLFDRSDKDIDTVIFNGTEHEVSHFTTSEFKFYERFQNLKDIYIHGVTSIDANSFEKYGNLDNIWITETDIEELPENLFAFNANLTYLVIVENKFTTLPENIFSNLKKLTYL